jgi:hypothetical protein
MYSDRVDVPVLNVGEMERALASARTIAVLGIKPDCILHNLVEFGPGHARFLAKEGPLDPTKRSF